MAGAADHGLLHVPLFLTSYSGGVPAIPPVSAVATGLTPVVSSVVSSNAVTDSGALTCLLKTKILQLEFVEMNELLPEAWSAAEALDTSLAVFKMPSRRSPVSDVGVWVESYALMVSVSVEQYPTKAVHFCAYLHRVTRAARNFQGSAWVAYDRMYCLAS